METGVSEAAPSVVESTNDNLTNTNSCPDCGTNIFPANGCVICMGCGYSPCG